MKIADIIKLLKEKGFTHNRYPRKTRDGKIRDQHFLMKGDCRIKIEGSIMEIEFVQTKGLLRVEGNLLGPFRDGVMFDLDSREMVR